MFGAGMGQLEIPVLFRQPALHHIRAALLYPPLTIALTCTIAGNQLLHRYYKETAEDPRRSEIPWPNRGIPIVASDILLGKSYCSIYYDYNK